MEGITSLQLLMRQAFGNYVADYIYHEDGTPMAFAYYALNGEVSYYYYETNLQGDIVAIYDSNGNAIVRYTYDAWGNFTETIVNSSVYNDNFRNAVLFRYRGYIYDTDTKLYYLQTRYYDPEVGRFISADAPEVITASPMSLTDKNLYAYCDNNPVMRADYGGAFWGTVFDVVSIVFSIVDVVNNPNDVGAWISLALDVVDLLPIISGMGEASKAIRLAEKTGENIKETADTIQNVTNIGWKVGDNITNFTKAGKAPSWSTVRRRYWKNEAFSNASKYADNDLVRMKKGLAPIRDGASMELHHTYGRNGANFYIFEPLTKAQHHFIHYGW